MIFEFIVKYVNELRRGNILYYSGDCVLVGSSGKSVSFWTHSKNDHKHHYVCFRSKTNRSSKIIDTLRYTQDSLKVFLSICEELLQRSETGMVEEYESKMHDIYEKMQMGYVIEQKRGEMLVQLKFFNDLTEWKEKTKIKIRRDDVIMMQGHVKEMAVA